MEFVMLPDLPQAGPVGTRIREQLGSAGRCRIDHASGRPWLIGDWAEHEITVVTAGSRRLATLGRTRLDGQAARRALTDAGSLHALDALARTLPGSCHLMASMDGHTRIQGSISTTHQVFTATVDQVQIAASNPDPLRRLTAAVLDLPSLAIRMLAPSGAPWPLSRRGLWTGIHQLEVGHWLHLDSRGGSHSRPWWSPPPSSKPLAVAAADLRAALDDAIRLRVGDEATVSADLSGGLDSTSLCFLVEALGGNLVTYHVAALDPANEDSAWATVAAEALPGARHRVLPATRPQNWFDRVPDPIRPMGDVEGPAPWASGRAHVRDLTTMVAADGSSRHLIGLGGDELFGPMPAQLWSLWRRHPIRGLPAIQRRRLLNRWPAGETIRSILDHQSFAKSLAASADTLTAPSPARMPPGRGWMSGLRMPAWASAEAVDTVARLLRETALAEPEPLDRDRTRHQVLASIVFEGTTLRQLNSELQGTGVTWEAPLLDDRVIEAALSLRIADRATPGAFKPLLAAAVRGLVPDGILDRGSKGEFSAEMYQGLERNRARLLDLCDDSELDRLGLIDVSALRAALLDPGPQSRHLAAFENTVACESWLRTTGAATPPAPSAPTGGPPSCIPSHAT